MSDIRQLFADSPVCDVCHTHGDITLRLTHFTEGRYASVVRCRDSYRCRERVESAGGSWPLLDSTAAPFESAIPEGVK